jgi:ligand-binding sensor domain-containing protein
LWFLSPKTPLRHIESEVIDKSPILDLQFDSEHNLWIHTLLEGIMIFDGASWQKVDVSSQLGGDDALAMFIDSDNGKWFASNHILAKLEQDSWQTDSLPLQFDKDVDKLTALFVDPEQETIWIGTTQGTVWNRGPEGLWTQHQLMSDKPASDVYVFHQDPSGQLWAGTDLGLFSHDALEWKYHGSPWDGHVTGNILVIAMDEKRQIWVGGSEGIGMMLENGEDWLYFDEHSPDMDGVSCIRLAKDGTMWFVGLGGVIQFIPGDHRKGVFSAYMSEKSLGLVGEPALHPCAASTP